MDNNSIEKHQIGALQCTDEVVIDCNLNELSNYLDKHEGGEVSGAVSVVQHDLSVLSGNIVQTGGVFTCGSGALAFGENSFAAGDDSCAGAKGWYYKAVDTASKKIYLTLTQQKPADIKFGSDVGQISPDTGFSVGDSVVGKRICLVNKNKDDFGSTTVAGVEDDTVLVYNGELVNKAISSVDPLDYDDYSVIISEAPDAGLIDRVSKNAFANGISAIASGRESHAEGRDTFAQGNYSHAEGRNTKALAYVAHAEGIDTVAGLYGTTGSYSHAEGNGVSAIGYTSHAEGYKTTASGSTSHSEGNSTEASGAASHAEGYKTTASGDYSHAEGGFDKSSGGSAIGDGSHAEGMLTLASGIISHAEGNQTQASASGAHAEGQKSVASGNYSHAEGNATSAMTEYSHAEGNGSVVSGLWSHAEGYQTSAFGNYSHAEGRQTVAGMVKDGDVAATYAAHAEGFGTNALGVASHAEGYYTKTNNDYEHAQGQYNKSNKANTTFGNARNTLHSIGIGTSDSNRKNAVEVMQNGDVYIKGIGNYDGTTIANKQNLAQVISAIQQNQELSNYLDRRVGGSITGDLSVVQHDIDILSGNYIQTSMPGNITNYASKNAIIQADVDPHYGDSYAGTKAFCVLGLSSATNQIKLSGDIQVLKDIVDGRLSVGDMPVDIGKSRSMRNVFGKDMFKEGDMVTNGTNMSAAMFSLTLDDRAASMSFHLSAVDVESGIVTLKESLKDADGFDTLDGHTTSFFEDLWLNDDNAFYLVGFPELGNANVPNNFGQFASGGSIRAIGRQTHAEGRDSIADIRYAHVEGSHCTAVHMATHAEGFRTVANKRYSHSEGEVTKADGRGSHAEGYKTMASGDYSHAEGMLTLASGIVAHAEGNQTQASATGAHAEGLKSIASGSYSHTEGNATSAVAEYSHAEGISSYTAGIASHAEGFKTLATGKYAHAEGEQTQAVTDNAHAAGFMSYAGGWNSTAIGRYSKVKDNDHNAFVWQGVHQNAYYESKGLGTFCINPIKGLSGFYIGGDNFIQCVLSAVQSMNETQKAALKTALGI